MTEMLVEVISPQGILFSSKNSVMATLPGSDGELGILANHCELVSTLEVGWIKIKQSNQKVERIFIAGGFLEVADNRVTILADIAEPMEQIDIPRAEAARKRAEKRLQHKGCDIDRAEMALKKSLMRLKVSDFR